MAASMGTRDHRLWSCEGDDDEFGRLPSFNYLMYETLQKFPLLRDNREGSAVASKPRLQVGHGVSVP